MQLSIQTHQALSGLRINQCLTALQVCAIIGVGICQWYFPELIEKVTAAPSIEVSTINLAALALLALFPLAKRPLWLRIALLVLELLVVTAGAVFGITRLWEILFIFLFAKAGLLLPLRALAISWMVALVACIGGKELRYVISQPAIFSLSVPEHIMHVIVFGRLINFELQIVFASMCTQALARETFVRQERQRLNQEIADLSARMERFRMSRDMHDSIGHLMTSICQHLDFAAMAIKKKPEKAYEALQIVRSTLEKLEGELTQFALKPEGNFDFLAALAKLLDQYRRDYPFKLDVKEDDGFSVPPHLGHDLFNIVKESLHNVQKYARAQHVSLLLKRDQHLLLLEIQDDGTGFDPSAVGNERYGLRGIAERLERIGGHLVLDSAPGKGTKISVTVPAVTLADQSNNLHQHE